METGNNIIVTVEATVHVPVERVWEYWTEPKHITKWNNASDDWHPPFAENDLRDGGNFLSRMEAKDGSVGFDLSGVYDEVRLNEVISYTLDDGRKVNITASSPLRRIKEKKTRQYWKLKEPVEDGVFICLLQKSMGLRNCYTFRNRGISIT